MLVAVGDSITAYDPDVRDDPDVPYRPWAVRLAASLGAEATLVARPGATAPDVAAHLLGAIPDGCRHGALYLGVNDVRSPDWDPEVFAAAFERVVGRLALAAEQLVVCTVPLDLGRPRAGAKVVDCNAIIAASAGAAGARVCRLEDLSGAEWVQDDAVHLTATGHLELARRAARTLEVVEPAA